MDNTISQNSVTGAVTERASTHGQRIRELQVGRSIVLEKIPQGGSLEARRLPSGGVQFYWRHTRDRRTERIPIGLYDPAAAPKALKPTHHGFSVRAAAEAARELAKQDHETPGGIRGRLEREESERRAAAEAAMLHRRYTLKALCDEYVAWLNKQGKVSAKDAQNVFKNHLLTPYPVLAAKAATEITKRDLVTALRALAEAQHLTTARKLRSYLRAAYACAAKADSDATLPSAFIGFQVVSNPVESTAAIQSRSDKNPLQLAELQQYWKQLQKEPGVIGAALRLHLLTGGQRPAQLVRLLRSEVSDVSLKLLDSKGKRSEPRPHVLPLTAEIRTELDLLSPAGYVLSTDGGTTAMHPSSLSAWASDCGKRAGVAGFQLKRVRSGIETVLAEAGISLHTRGLLQSHGIGGVQERHYDAHSYLPEKLQALQTLFRLLTQSKESNVTPIRARRARAGARRVA